MTSPNHTIFERIKINRLPSKILIDQCNFYLIKTIFYTKLSVSQNEYKVTSEQFNYWSNFKYTTTKMFHFQVPNYNIKIDDIYCIIMFSITYFYNHTVCMLLMISLLWATKYLVLKTDISKNKTCL